MRNIEVVVFDCDGVLFDTEGANRAYYNRILDHFGKPGMTADQFAYIHMHTVDESISYLLADEPEIEAAHRFRRRMDYNDFYRYMRIEPDLKALLKKIRPAFRTAVATNRSDTIRPLLDHFKLGDSFDLVVSALDVERPKPSPDTILKVIAFFGIAPEQGVYVGDSKVDEAASQAAGMPLVAYRNRTLTADHYIDRLKELENIIGA